MEITKKHSKYREISYWITYPQNRNAPHKDQIENELFQREKTLFSLKQTVTLYDITNTYFEGRGSPFH